MIDIEGIGSEGVIILGTFLLIKDVLIPLTKKVVIPLAQKLLKRTNNPGTKTVRSLSENSLTLGKLKQAVNKHEEADEKRHDEIKGEFKDIRTEVKEEFKGIQSDLRDLDGRLRVQENRTG